MASFNYNYCEGEFLGVLCHIQVLGYVVKLKTELFRSGAVDGAHGAADVHCGEPSCSEVWFGHDADARAVGGHPACRTRTTRRCARHRDRSVCHRAAAAGAGAERAVGRARPATGAVGRLWGLPARASPARRLRDARSTLTPIGACARARGHDTRAALLEGILQAAARESGIDPGVALFHMDSAHLQGGPTAHQTAHTADGRPHCRVASERRVDGDAAYALADLAVLGVWLRRPLPHTLLSRRQAVATHPLAMARQYGLRTRRDGSRLLLPQVFSIYMWTPPLLLFPYIKRFNSSEHLISRSATSGSQSSATRLRTGRVSVESQLSNEASRGEAAERSHSRHERSHSRHTLGGGGARFVQLFSTSESFKLL